MAYEHDTSKSHFPGRFTIKICDTNVEFKDEQLIMHPTDNKNNKMKTTYPKWVSYRPIDGSTEGTFSFEFYHMQEPK